MSYTWQNGQVITAEKLNNNCKIQFVNILQDTENQTVYLDKNWQQIKSIYDAGGIVYVKNTEENDNLFGIAIGHVLYIIHEEEIYRIHIQMPEGRSDFIASNPTEQLTWIINNDSSDDNNPVVY